MDRCREKHGQNGDQGHGGGLGGQLDRKRQEYPRGQPPIPRDRAHRRHDAIHEADRRAHGLDPLEERDSGAQPLQLAPAFRAIGQVGLHQGALPGREDLIEELGHPLAGLVTGHGRNRSIFSLRSRRAR